MSISGFFSSATFKVVAASACVLVAFVSATRADDFFLHDGDKVIFYGDSITQAGGYVSYVEAFLLTRFPKQHFTIINHGITSETISGTSEPDHTPRRPWALERFDRDIARWKPSVVIACFGMNDGNYYPPDPERFARYQAGIARLRKQVGELGARLVLLTPPPFDPYRRQVADPKAKSFGYKFPAVNYDDTLETFSKWLVTQHGADLIVADLHSATNNLLRLRRRNEVSFFLAGDAVHPSATGHWVMAQTLLEACHAPAVAADITLDWKAPEAAVPEIKDVAASDTGLRFRWNAPLPAPRDPEWDAEAIGLLRTAESLNRYRLTVKNLPKGNYQLVFADKPLLKAADKAWAEGVDLAAVQNFPTVVASQKVLELVAKRRQELYSLWRDRIANADPTDDVYDEAKIESASKLYKQARALAQPTELELTLRRVK